MFYKIPNKVKYILLLFSFIVKSQTMQELKDFVEYGNKAPSSHNAKMWSSKIDSINKSIYVSLDERFKLSEVDPNNREAWISIGAFVQNIIFIAEDFGYTSKVKLGTDTIVVRFSEYLGKRSRYKDLILKRHTTRKPFKKDNINEIISEIVDDGNNKNIIYFDNVSEEFREIVNLSKQANEQQINNQNKRVELAQWINFSDKRRERGMSLKNLGMNGIESFLFRNFIGEKGFVNSDFVKQQYLKTSNKLYDKCAGYLMILSQNNTKKDWFNSGRLLQRIWMKLTEKNINVQPMSQLIEEEYYYSLFKNKIQLKGEVQMLLRVGK